MTVATYVRVSTEDQTLDRQLERTTEYATTTIGADLSAVDTYRDKATGTDTGRQGFRELLAAVDAGEYEHVVANSVSRISRSIRDLDQTVERIVEDGGAELHIIGEGLRMAPDEDDPYQRALMQMLGVFAELEAEMTRNRVREGIKTRMQNEDYHHGPPPLGFDKEDGHLIQAAGYDHVRSTLELVRDDDLSKRKAARELDTSRRTINRSLERLELYDLGE
jgi:DNA invertase Pin-like site-specific DNA recombinase